MEKRVIVAFVLSFAVLYAFRSLFTPPPQPPEPAASVQSPVTPPPSTPPSAAKAPAQKTEPPTAGPEEDVRAEKPEEVVFNTPLYTATFSNVGAVLKSFRLQAYSDGEGHPVELINQDASNKVGWPLALMTGDKALDEELGAAPSVGHKDGDKLTLEFASNGLHVRKTLEFDRENYEFALQTTLTKDGKRDRKSTRLNSSHWL